MPKQRSKSIDAYREKRDFARTPEPPPEKGAQPPSAAFVVHRHEARRLHYDLRLEMEGVLKSWAVPKGFSYDPSEKRLAVRTEDHPLAYIDFEGVIPRGEYGGGTMTIWDHGRFELHKAADGAKAVDAGKLEIRLRGRKLRGEWHLVKTRSDKDEWLLFKARDRYAREEGEKPPFFDLTGAVEAPVPEHVDPMRPSAGEGPFSDPDWIFEAEFSGRRAAIRKAGDDVRVVTARGEEYTDALDEIVRQAASLRAENAWVDGVLVVTDEGNRPSLERLSSRLRGESTDPVVFYAFDLPYHEEWDLRTLPLLERKEVLASLLPRLSHILYVDHVQGRGEDFCAVTAAAGLPAVIAKKAASSYGSGPSGEWRRIALEPASDVPGEDLLEALRTRAPRRRRVQLSNLDKVFWPKEGYTKGDLVHYYEQIAETLLPYLHERPVHMLRYPDGIDGKSFYQKDAPDHIPEWIVTEPIESDTKGESIRYIVCNDRDTLIYMANLASIDLHPWLSRRGSLDTPDWAVFDLDPDDSPFPNVVKVARTLGKVLRGIGLRPYLKTSGATGLHIYVALEPHYSYENARQFAEAVATYVASEHKDIATVERVVSRRRGKVYIDFLQNRRGQTVVPPYVVRPRPGAPVSTPLDWDELDSELDPTRFNLATILPRLAQRGDLFQGTLRDRQELLPAIDAFQKRYLQQG